MTKEELLAISLKQKTIEAFGGEVEVRELTIGQSALVSKMSSDVDKMILGVQFALVEPQMTFDELKELPSRLVEDFPIIIEAVSIEAKKIK